MKIGLSKRRRRGKEILLNCINGHLDAHRWPQRALIIHSSSFRFFCFAFVRPFLCYEEIITILFHGVHFRNSILSISYFSVPNFTSLFIDALIFLHRVLKFFLNKSDLFLLNFSISRKEIFSLSSHHFSLSLSLSVESANSFHRLENFLFHTDDTLFLQHNGRNKFARGASRGERYNFRSMHTADERNGIKEIQSRAV